MGDSLNKHVYCYGAHYMNNGAIMVAQNCCKYPVSVGLFTFRRIFSFMENLLICFLRDDDKMRKSNFPLRFSLTLDLEDLFQSVL